MGVTVWLRHLFIQQVLSEHLNNKEYYDNITSEIGHYKVWLENQWRTFIDRHGPYLPDSVVTFFYCSDKRSMAGIILPHSVPLLKSTKLECQCGQLLPNAVQ
eukprot:scaffold30255_cov52-Cyclotella_meneghiniana.AAC.2